MPIDKINIDNFEVKPVTNDPKYGRSSQLLYKDPVKGEFPVMTQFGDTEFNTYKAGIPRYHKAYAKTEDVRRCIFWPTDKKTKTGKKIYGKLKELDKFMDSKPIKKTLFGDDWKDAKYLPIVKIPNPEDPNDKSGQPKNITPYIKCKLKFFPMNNRKDDDKKSKNRDRDEEEEMIFTSELYIDGKSPTDDDGKPLEITKVDQLCELIPWGSSGKGVMIIRRIWVGKPKKRNETSFEYGVTINVQALQIKPKKSGSRGKTKFLDDDDEKDDDEEDEKPKKSDKKKRSKKDDDDD